MARYALVIGVSKYQNASLPQLPKAATDAEEVAKILETHGGFEVERLPKQWNKQKDCWEIAAKEVTNTKVIDKLKTLLWERGARSEVLIYIAGHGIRVDEYKLNKLRGFLVVSDCTIQLREDKVVKQENGIPLDIIDWLISKKECRVSSLVMLLDFCHSGSLLENQEIRKSFTKLAETDYYLIAGCRHFENARAFKGEPNSIFTGALLKGLSADNANHDGAISCDRLFAVIDEELKGKGQEPIRLGYGRSLVLVSYPGRSPVLAIEPLRDEREEIRCPYQGLLAFTKAELPFFFGREQVVEELARKLERRSFVPLIGASGSGKSSVVLAGLVSRLEELGWQVLDPLKPGFKPLARLEDVLRKKYFSDEEQLLDEYIHDKSSEGLKLLLKRFSQKRHLLVVDQFEELFTVAQAEQRDRFIELITQVATIPDSPLAVVTTMRADFIEPCLRYDVLRQLIEKEAKYLPALTGKNLIDAICLPAKRQGYEVTDELLDRILEDIKQEPGFLPLLEFALTQLWQKRDEAEHQLTLKAYEAIGGMGGALNCHADKVYRYRDYEKDSSQDERTEAERALIKRIFLNLLQIGDGEKDTRLRQPKAVILSLAGDNQEEKKFLTELIESKQGLVKGRLLVTGGSEGEGNAWVDLAHEALIEKWGQLNEWRTENREGRKLAKQAEKDAQTWKEHAKLPDYLWRGYKLTEAEKVLQEYTATVSLSEQAKEFIGASSQEELRSYLRSPDIDNLDQKVLEKETADKSFLSKERLRHLLKDEREDAWVRLTASWLLEQWGEEMPIQMAEVDGEGKILLRVIEEKLPPTVVEDLGNGISLELVEIPGGEFWMGSPEGEEGSYSEERPRHKVKVSPFLMGRYPVTQAQWRAVASLTQVERELNPEPSYFKGDSRPVEMVSWYEAVEFCRRLSLATGKEYRLPSEAEWEYVCRAGTETPFHFGQKIFPGLANYLEGARGRTTPVRRFQVANSFVLYDMHGNVWEWCADHWHDNYDGAPTDGSAWLSENENNYFVLRGGSWHSIPDDCRCAVRYYFGPDSRVTYFGFRVVAVARTWGVATIRILDTKDLG